MTVLKCKMCESILEVSENVSPSASYICREHTRYEQDVFFQEHAFDSELARGTIRASGTEDDACDMGAEINQER